MKHLAQRLAVAVGWLALVAVAGCSHQTTTAAAQRVSIQVTDQGFEPAVVSVKAGVPVTLVVKRVTDQTCATELVMKSQHIHQQLPLNQAVEITFTPERAGDLVYACGMDMYRGTVHVE